MRNGVPLSDRTAEQVVSLLIHRVLGPLRPDRIRMVLDYHGLAGHAAATPQETARRCCVTLGMINVRTGKVRAAGATLPVEPAIISAAMRDSGPGDDHLGRARIARSLRLPTPGRSATSRRHLTCERWVSQLFTSYAAQRQTRLASVGFPVATRSEHCSAPRRPAI